MEKYFIVGVDTELYREYDAYLESQREIREVIVLFFKKHNIQANEYRAGSTSLWIKATAEDLKNFGDQMSKNADRAGARFFKKNSEILCLWAKEVKATGLRIFPKVYLRKWFSSSFQLSSRIFMHHDLLYLWVESDCNFDTPEGFAEIKMSKFYEALEDYTDGE